MLVVSMAMRQLSKPSSRGRFTVADLIEPSTPAAIVALHQFGLKVAMISGDNLRTAKAIAARLGIDEVVAEVLPEVKVEAIQRLKTQQAAWPSWATVSTTRRRWPRRTWAWRSAAARMWR